MESARTSEASAGATCGVLRRAGLALSALAIVGVAVAGCTPRNEKPSEQTTEPEPTKTESPPASPTGNAPSPTEKAPALPTGGPNSFTPSVKAPAAPTALPGNVITGQ